MGSDPKTMSVEECRDWLARSVGVVTDKAGFRHLDGDDMHPFPATLDGAASAMPVGWWWTRSWRNTAANPSTSVIMWCAWMTGKSREILDTGDEKLDRYRLAVACRLVTKEPPCPPT